MTEPDDDTAESSTQKESTSVSRDMSGVVIRLMISVAIMVAVIWQVTRGVETGRFMLSSLTGAGLLFYCMVAYVLRPKYMKNARPRSLRQRKIRSQLMFLEMCLWPGRFAATSLLDFGAMLLGRQVDHSQSKIDVTP